MVQIAYVIIWWLVLLFIGLVTFPLVSRVCKSLPDRGYSITKILGILLITFISYLLASIHIFKFGYLNLSVSILLLIAISYFASRKHFNLRAIPWKTILISEAGFTAAYVLFLIFLYYTPDIAFANSEDFMDYAFIKSIMRSGYFPPTDPWLAGETIPYYYGGHMATAVLILFSRVPPAIAYNLAVAMFFALALYASFGLGYNLTRRKLYGFTAVIFVCVAGFLSGAFQLTAFSLDREFMSYHPTDAQNFAEWLSSADFISANWLIEGAAVRNPVYAFLVGDLHSDVTDIPFHLLFITLILALFLTKRNTPDGIISKSDSLLVIVILGLSLGFLAFIDTWSYPTYLLFGILAFILLKLHVGWKGLLGIIFLSIILFLPYHITRGSGGIREIGIVSNRTDLIEFIEVFALFMLAIFSSFYFTFRGRVFKSETLIVMTVLVISVASISFLLDFEILLILVPLILAPLYCIYRARDKKETEFMLTLALTGALIVLFCEVFYIKTPIGGDFARFVTMAHFYIQIWVLFALAAAYAVYLVVKNCRGGFKYTWSTLLMLLVLASLIQPIGLVTQWKSEKHDKYGINRGTLDGSAYVKTIAPSDYEAITWINKHIKGSRVILEAPGAAYQYTSQISTFTGLPTVIGWMNPHEIMWRGGWDEASGRDTEVDAIYNSPGSEEAISVLMKYNVQYIYAGILERDRYGEQALALFDAHPEMYKPVYRNPEVTVYELMYHGN